MKPAIAVDSQGLTGKFLEFRGALDGFEKGEEAWESQ
jgi:hypothetical protein